MPSVTRRSNGTRAAARRGEMRTRMLEAVERLLGEGESFTELSVDRIVTEAGTSRTTFYSYFDDKGHMLRELTADVLELTFRAGRGWWQHISEPDSTALRAGIEELVEVYREHSALMAAIVGTASYDREVEAEFAGMVEAGRRELADHIRLGQEAGTIRAQLDPELSSGWLVWMVERGLHQMVREADQADADSYAAELVEALWCWLYEPQAG